MGGSFIFILWITICIIISILSVFNSSILFLRTNLIFWQNCKFQLPFYINQIRFSCSILGSGASRIALLRGIYTSWIVCRPQRRWLIQLLSSKINDLLPDFSFDSCFETWCAFSRPYLLLTITNSTFSIISQQMEMPGPCQPTSRTHSWTTMSRFCTSSIAETTRLSTHTPLRILRSQGGRQAGQDWRRSHTDCSTEKACRRGIAPTRSSRMRSFCSVRLHRSKRPSRDRDISTTTRWCSPMCREAIRIKEIAKSNHQKCKHGSTVSTSILKWTRRTLGPTISRGSCRILASVLPGWRRKNGRWCALPCEGSFQVAKTIRKGDSSSLKNSLGKRDKNCTSSDLFSATSSTSWAKGRISSATSSWAAKAYSSSSRTSRSASTLQAEEPTSEAQGKTTKMMSMPWTPPKETKSSWSIRKNSSISRARSSTFSANLTKRRTHNWFRGQRRRSTQRRRLIQPMWALKWALKLIETVCSHTTPRKGCKHAERRPAKSSKSCANSRSCQCPCSRGWSPFIQTPKSWGRPRSWQLLWTSTVKAPRPSSLCNSERSSIDLISACPTSKIRIWFPSMIKAPTGICTGTNMRLWWGWTGRSRQQMLSRTRREGLLRQQSLIMGRASFRAATSLTRPGWPVESLWPTRSQVKCYITRSFWTSMTTASWTPCKTWTTNWSKTARSTTTTRRAATTQTSSQTTRSTPTPKMLTSEPNRTPKNDSWMASVARKEALK